MNFQFFHFHFLLLTKQLPYLQITNYWMRPPAPNSSCGNASQLFSFLLLSPSSLPISYTPLFSRSKSKSKLHKTFIINPKGYLFRDLLLNWKGGMAKKEATTAEDWIAILGGVVGGGGDGSLVVAFAAWFAWLGCESCLRGWGVNRGWAPTWLRLGSGVRLWEEGERVWGWFVVNENISAIVCS